MSRWIRGCRRVLVGAALGIGLALVATLSHAISSGTTAQGVAFVSGGVGEGEQQAMTEAKGRYSLWLTTATKRRGAWVADVRVRITDARGNTVLEHRTDGPWLMVALPPGAYHLEARYQDSTDAPVEAQRASFSIAAGAAQHRLTLYFDARAD